jgi:hypothetical protein
MVVFEKAKHLFKRGPQKKERGGCGPGKKGIFELKPIVFGFFQLLRLRILREHFI